MRLADALGEPVLRVALRGEALRAKSRMLMRLSTLGASKNTRVVVACRVSVGRSHISPGRQPTRTVAYPHTKLAPSSETSET